MTRTPRRTPVRPRLRRLGRVRRTDDRGSSILEFAGFLPFLLLFAMAAVQLGIIGYGASQAGSGARAAARAASQGEPGVPAGQAAVSGWLDATVDAPPASGPGVTTATVTVQIPSVVPMFGGPWPLTRRVTMPNDFSE
jgi:Flp pilus assembly protein TadG